MLVEEDTVYLCICISGRNWTVQISHWRENTSPWGAAGTRGFENQLQGWPHAQPPPRCPRRPASMHGPPGMDRNSSTHHLSFHKQPGAGARVLIPAALRVAAAQGQVQAKGPHHSGTCRAKAGAAGGFRASACLWPLPTAGRTLQGRGPEHRQAHSPVPTDAPVLLRK